MASSPVVNTILDKDTDPEIRWITSTGEPLNRIFKFSDIPMSLNKNLLKGLHQDLDLRRPNMMQSIYFGLALVPPFRSVIAQTRPTQDKFICYVLSMLAHVSTDVNKPQALCVVLDMDVGNRVLQLVHQMGRYKGIVGEVLFDTPYPPNITSHVVIGSPAIVKNYIQQRKLDTSHLEVVVFDECVWRIWELEAVMNFIKMRVSKHPQVLIFSSCINDAVKSGCAKVLGDRSFNRLYVNEEEFAIDNCQHFKIVLPDKSEKKNYVVKLLGHITKMSQVIIFVNPERLKEVCDRVRFRGFNFDMSTPELIPVFETEHFDYFKKRDTQILISSAKGIDWRFDESNVTMVINVDLPTTSELDYEELYKRTSRAGRRRLKGEREKTMIETFERFHLKRRMIQLAWDSTSSIPDAFARAGY